MSLTALFGGARSGKSSLAVEIGERFDGPGQVTFIATAPAFDGDMTQRIERHRAERPDEWTTVEEQIEVGAAIAAAPPGLVIVDCLTLWTSNMMWADHSDDHIRERSTAAAEQAASRDDHVVVISNEVGLGIVPDNELSRRYRDVHGWVNQAWAARSDRALHLVAGRATALVDPWTLLDGI